eukprot:COSAG01_NODE_22708_length_844_cov_9.194631_1_plen_143_part_00
MRRARVTALNQQLRQLALDAAPPAGRLIAAEKGDLGRGVDASMPQAAVLAGFEKVAACSTPRDDQRRPAARSNHAPGSSARPPPPHRGARVVEAGRLFNATGAAIALAAPAAPAPRRSPTFITLHGAQSSSSSRKQPGGPPR